MREPPESERPSWMGAPGYTPAPPLPPHAPMPGAPPYPGPAARPPTPIGRPAPVATLPIVVAATAAWTAVNMLLVIVWPGQASLAQLGAGMLISAVLAALIGWMVVRRRVWSFWVVLVVVAPIYWALRAVLATFIG